MKEWTFRDVGLPNGVVVRKWENEDLPSSPRYEITGPVSSVGGKLEETVPIDEPVYEMILRAFGKGG